MRKVIGLGVALLVLGLGLGCKPAGKYGLPRGQKPAVAASASNKDVASGKSPEAKFAAQNTVWLEPDATDLEPPVPIRFVTEGAERDEWAKLKHFWNVSSDVNPRPTPDQVAMLVGGPSWNLVPLAAQVNQVVKIKVPLGLEDPLAYTPAVNRPTLGKWELGKQLFYDKDTFLQDASAEKKESCASCHDPAKGFTNGRIPGVGERAVPRLLNCAYNSFEFWDGRANALEEVVQRSIDEMTPPGPESSFRHNWTGVVERLRKNDHYAYRFRKVFGTPPTQDAVGKAVATYLRTLLSGGSLQDRVEREMRHRSGTAVEVRDYERMLTDAAYSELKVEERMKKEDVAKQLHDGYLLFRGKAGCIACHGGSNYTDNSFHNIGVGDSGRTLVGTETGRFVVLPVGLKDRRMVGAYKTPSLRSLPERGPFFHDGLRLGDDSLFDVVSFHVRGGMANPYLDSHLKPLDLKENEVRALVLFLKGLEGQALPEDIIEAPVLPELMNAPKKEVPAK
jgi:cytochrome c peroxidase